METPETQESLIKKLDERGRFRLIAACVICFALFWYVGNWFGIPQFRGFSASMLQQSGPLIVLIITTVTMVASVLVGSLVAGSVRFDAGLVSTAIGLAAFSLRGGPMRYVLMSGQGPITYVVMALEVAVLFGMVAAAWAVLWVLHNNGWLQGDAFRDGVEDVDDSLNQKLLALATQVVTMLILMQIFSQSDAKPQVIASIAIASFLGTLAAHALFPVQPSIWYWFGPGIVALIGYLWSYMAPDSWFIGIIGQPLARPMPLDYASVGIAASVWAYWMSRHWLAAKQDEPEAGAKATDAFVAAAKGAKPTGSSPSA